jgi:hypothetical protein
MDIIKELNIGSFSEEEKNKILVKFADSLAKRIVLRVCNNLSSQDYEELNDLTKKGNETEINNFLNKKNPNIKKIRDEEAESLIKAMKQFISVK